MFFLKTGKLGKAIDAIIKVLAEKEKKQDKVLSLSREIVRDCAKAIKSVHSGETKEFRESLSAVEKGVKKLKQVDADFHHISQQCYQEYVELHALAAVLEKKDFPSHEELCVPVIPYLNGLADVVGELRRQIQVSLKNGNKKEAEYFYDRMNELYETLMLIKFAPSLVGGLRRKMDVARVQVEQARSEILR